MIHGAILQTDKAVAQLTNTGPYGRSELQHKLTHRDKGDIVGYTQHKHADNLPNLNIMMRMWIVENKKSPRGCMNEHSS